MARIRKQASKFKLGKGDEDVGEPSTVTQSLAVTESSAVTEPPTKPEATSNGDVESGTSIAKEETETPQMNLWATIGLLGTVTVLVAITAEWLVDSINGMTDSGTIGKEFVGIILLPIVGNAAEHVTAVTVSVKDKLTLSLGVAVGSSINTLT
ncbi:hypothetical protein DXG01_004276 [Tephrocybe rancida]|nr:hypothetical protein DXG01_004276 [Tephrocybe rancida]